ncbi:MAG: DUF4268 domain-containing protein, partial [Planctomycetota bacterium]
MKLGKLTRVELRDYWKHEALDFTRWLCEPENIELLSDEIGVDMRVVQSEASVGRFYVDILAEEENTGRKIVIENQLEATNHGHLGQLITYAAGLEAAFVVWIVRDEKEEHRQAIDWLNEHTDEEVNFFLVRIELWQIDNSPPAPKFNVICRPNEWTRALRAGAQDGDLTDTKVRQLQFWQQLKEFAATHYPELRLRTPHPQQWFSVAVGRSDCYVAMTINSKTNKVGCELYIPHSKELYHTLHAQKAEIEKALDIA